MQKNLRQQIKDRISEVALDNPLIFDRYFGAGRIAKKTRRIKEIDETISRLTRERKIVVRKLKIFKKSLSMGLSAMQFYRCCEENQIRNEKINSIKMNNEIERLRRQRMILVSHTNKLRRGWFPLRAPAQFYHCSHRFVDNEK